MTELVVVPTGPLVRPARDRGTLDIAERVVAKIAGRAAGEVDGVDVRPAGRLRGLWASGTLDVDAEVNDKAASVTVTVAVEYPRPVFDIAAQVRRQVAARLGQLAGLERVEVRVEIAELITGGGPAGPRVV